VVVYHHIVTGEVLERDFWWCSHLGVDVVGIVLVDVY
jgi:hypothetical protein